MARFQYEKKQNSKHGLLLSLGLFACMLLVFYYGIFTMADSTDEKERESLENALERGIIHCYAAEGFYPESLDYLVQNYGVIYDTDKYFVDYRIQGTNLMPDVTIIRKGD